MGILEYYVTHVFPTGWRTISNAFQMWKDLLTENYSSYTLLDEDDPFEECRAWFWTTLGEDDIYPREFLNDLLEMCDRIDRGEEKLIPFDIDQLNRINELLEGVSCEKFD